VHRPGDWQHVYGMQHTESQRPRLPLCSGSSRSPAGRSRGALASMRPPQTQGVAL